MSSAAASKIISVIHEAALDPQRWQRVSDVLAAEGQCYGVHMLFFDSTNPRPRGCFQSGYAPEMLESFLSYYGAINPWRRGLARLAPLTAVTSEQMLPHVDLVKTEFHADWLRPQGDISAGAGMILERDSQRMLVMGGHIRMRDQDRLEHKWQKLVGEIGPVLRHAVQVNRALAELCLENKILAQGMRPACASVLVLSDDLRLLFANEAANRDLAVLAVGRGCGTRFSLRDSRAQAALEDALRRSRSGGPPVMLRIADLVARTFRIAHLLRVGPDVLPFAGVDLVRRSVPLSVAVLVLPATNMGTLLNRNFGLTLTEVEIALALYSGQTLAEIAEARRTSPHTVRAQSKAILSKCGVRRQAELIGLLSLTLR